VVLLLSGLIVAVSATPATAAVSGIDPTLCKSTTSRVSVPTGYPLAVCFTGSAVTIKNNTVYVLHISATGVTGTPTRSGSGGDLAGLVVAHSDPSPYELPPGFSVTAPVGDGAASFTQAGSPQETEYGRLRLLSTLIPGDAYADYSAVDDFVNSLGADSSTYAQCKVNANLFKQAACAAAFSWDVGEAVAILGTTIGAQFGSPILGSIINLVSSAEWVSVGVNQFITILHSPKTFTIASVAPGVPAVQPTPPTTSTSSGTPAPNVETNPEVQFTGLLGTQAMRTIMSFGPPQSVSQSGMSQQSIDSCGADISDAVVVRATLQILNATGDPPPSGALEIAEEFDESGFDPGLLYFVVDESSGPHCTTPGNGLASVQVEVQPGMTTNATMWFVMGGAQTRDSLTALGQWTVLSPTIFLNGAAATLGDIFGTRVVTCGGDGADGGTSYLVPAGTPPASLSNGESCQAPPDPLANG
jgi:hypothetical protein